MIKLVVKAQSSTGLFTLGTLSDHCACPVYQSVFCSLVSPVLSGIVIANDRVAFDGETPKDRSV